MRDVCALVPPRKAVWSLPGKSKTTGKAFFLLLLLCFIPIGETWASLAPGHVRHMALFSMQIKIKSWETYLNITCEEFVF